jgi:23S rRNA G2069 N7-methylase RlmK/C1962 C5-methylase RlmI
MDAMRRLQGDPPALAQAAWTKAASSQLSAASYHASRELFMDNLVGRRPVDAKKSARCVMNHAQRADHPDLIRFPETGYLKGFTVEVMRLAVNK